MWPVSCPSVVASAVFVSAVLTCGMGSISDASAQTPTTSTSSSVATKKARASKKQCTAYAKLSDTLDSLAATLRCKGIRNLRRHQHLGWCKTQNAIGLRVQEEKLKKQVRKCIQGKRFKKLATKSCKNYGLYASRMEAGLKSLRCGSVVVARKKHQKWCDAHRHKRHIPRQHQKSRGDALAKCVAKQRTKMDAPPKAKKRPAFVKWKKKKQAGGQPSGGKRPGGKEPTGGKQPSCVWKTSDIIENRIGCSPSCDKKGGDGKDIGAQWSLMRMMHGTDDQIRKASAIIGAIKSGKLAGVHIFNKGHASKRAAKTKAKAFWNLIPKGKRATCIKSPSNLAPMIVHHEKLTQEQMDAAILEAWSGCGLPTPKDACEYVVDRWKPPPVKEMEDTECPIALGREDVGDQICLDKYPFVRERCVSGICKECRVDADCVALGKKQGDFKLKFCLPDNICTISPKPPKPADVVCVGAEGKCGPDKYCKLPPKGDFGVCRPSKTKTHCELKAGKASSKAYNVCKAASLKSIKTCVIGLIKGTVKAGVKWPDPTKPWEAVSKFLFLPKYAYCHWKSHTTWKSCRMEAMLQERESVRHCKDL
jgi:hypothetical protein